MKTASHFRRTLLAQLFPAVSAVMVVSTLSAQASTSTWAGGTSGSWATAGSWTGTDAPPLATDTAQFGGTTAETASVSGTAQTIGGITVSNTAATIITNNSNTAGSLTIGSGGITIASGSGAVTLENTSAANTGALTVNLGASQTWANNGANPFTVSSNITNTSSSPSTLTLGGIGAGAITISGIISDGGAGKTGLTVASGGSAGAVNLTNANTYTGTTTVGSGTLNLNFAAASAPTNNIISSASALIMGGGGYGASTLNVATANGASNSQTFASTTFNQGASVFSISNGNASSNGLVNLGAITRNEGSAVNFVSPTVNTTSSATNGYSTTTGTTNGILGGYATYNGNDWATVNGSGNIVAYTGYTSVATGSSASGWTSGQNISIDSGGTGVVTLPAGTFSSPTNTSINSLRFNNAGGTSVTGTNTNSISFAGATQGSTILTLSSGNTSGLFVGEQLGVVGGTLPSGAFITGILSSTQVSISVPTNNLTTVPWNASIYANVLQVGSGGILETSNVGSNTSTITGSLLQGPGDGDIVITQNNGTAATSGLVIGSAIDNNGSSPTGLTKAGAGSVTLTNVASNFSGPVSVDGGTLEVDNLASLGATYVASGAVLTQNTTAGSSTVPLTFTIGPITGGGTIKFGNPSAVGNFVINETSNSTFSGSISGFTGGNTQTVNKNGAGTLTLTGAGALNLYRGFNVNAGTLDFAGAATITNFNSGGAGRLAAGINQGAAITVDDSGTNVASRLGQINDALTMSGGTFNLIGATTGTTTETIATHVSGGGTSGLIMAAGSNVVNVTSNSSTGSTTLTFGSTYSRTAGATTLFSGTNLGSTPGANNANVFISTAPTLTGGATAGQANYGVITGAFVDSISSTGSNTYSIATYDATKGVRGLASNETIGTMTASDNVLATTALTNGTLAINSLTLGTGGSVDNTAGTLTVTSDNILSTGANTSIGAGGGSTLAFVSTGTTEASIYTAPSSTLTIGAAISSTSGLTTGGSGATVLTGNNASTLTGTVTVNGGILSISAANNLGATTNAVAINNGGELQSTGANVSLGSGSITLGGTTANTITSGDIDVSGASTNTLTQGTGIIGGVGSLTKSGVGVLTLNQTNTYAGATQINGGALNLTSAGSTTATSTVTVGGATGSGVLEGSGTVNGALITSSAGTGIVAPGTVGAIGTLHVGSLGFQVGAGTNFDYDLASTVTAGGTTNDLITMSGGTLTIGGSGIVFNFSGASLATTGSYTLISGATSIAGFSASDFSAAGTSDTATFTTVGNNLYVSFGAPVVVASTNYYFTGSTSGSFTDGTNYVTTAGGGTAQTGTLSSTSNVFLNANTTTPANTPVTLNTASTINSLTFVTAGTSLNGTGTLTVEAGITDSATGGTTETIQPKVTLGASQGWTVSTSSNTLAVSGSIAGTSGQTLTLNGPGKFVFNSGTTGTNFAGNTTLASGSLFITNGNTGSALGTGTFTVARGATFGGAGTATGLAAFSIGNTGSGTTQIQVGNGSDTSSKLTLTATGASTISNANLAFNLSTSSTAANQLNLGNTGITFSNTTLALNMTGGQIVAPNTSYVLITDAAGFQGLTTSGNVITGGLSIAANSFFGTESGGYSTGFYNGSYLFLADGGTEIDVEVVPEPGTWALMLGGLGMLFFWQRRRQALRA